MSGIDCQTTDPPDLVGLLKFGIRDINVRLVNFCFLFSKILVIVLEVTCPLHIATKNCELRSNGDQSVNILSTVKSRLARNISV